jgi:NADH:ubiquinone oxidoreductase subunit 3 (subunit A)
MKNLLLSPPIAFIIFLVLSVLISGFTKLLSAKGKESEGKNKSYGCGEEVTQNKVQPDYTQFFSFAFFFTIMHVVALIIATIPAGFSIMPVIYIVVAVITLFMLFRR